MEITTVEELIQAFGLDRATAEFIHAFHDGYTSDVIEVGPDGQERPAAPGPGLFDDGPPTDPRLVVPIDKEL